MDYIPCRVVRTPKIIIFTNIYYHINLLINEQNMRYVQKAATKATTTKKNERLIFLKIVTLAYNTF